MARSLENNESIERRLKRLTPSEELALSLSVGDRDLNTVLPAIFDPVHGGVRRLNQLVSSNGHIRKSGHADRRGEVNIEAVAGQETVSSDPLPDALCNRAGARRAGIGQDQGKFIAAKPRDDVGFTRAAANDRAGFHQRTAAREMPMTIVDRFEAIEIDE